MKPLYLFHSILIFIELFAMHDVFAGEDNLQPIHTISFNQPSSLSPLEWFQEQNYVLGLDAEDFEYHFNDNGLTISTQSKKAAIFGIPFKNTDKFNDIDYVDIEWGVKRYPVKANWEKKKRKVAIASMFFFGTKKISSGLPFGIHSAPYFISSFIGNAEPVNKVYKGKLYKKGGRYINVANSEQKGQLITNRIYLKKRFLEFYDEESVPPLSGFAIQMNSKGSKGGAESFIKSIKFYSLSKSSKQ
jgi:hypothetical protein